METRCPRCLVVKNAAEAGATAPGKTNLRARVGGLKECRADLHNHLLILTFTWPNRRETLASVTTRVRVCHGLLPSRLPRGELFDKNKGRGSRVRGLLRESTRIPQICDAVFPHLPAILPHLASDVCNSSRTPFFDPQAVNPRARYGSTEQMGLKPVQNHVPRPSRHPAHLSRRCVGSNEASRVLHSRGRATPESQRCSAKHNTWPDHRDSIGNVLQPLPTVTWTIGQLPTDEHPPFTVHRSPPPRLVFYEGHSSLAPSNTTQHLQAVMREPYEMSLWAPPSP
ncbi:hypothetical protein LY76DRAFT_56037 [Colletotrichum caudatum]|nr:hypothetical protein LY76DRAFT_56037 [Colletotrichum caudatum]